MPCPVRILVYTENTVVGGSERYLRDIVGSLVDRGFDVAVGCNPNEQLVTYLRAIRLGVSVEVLPVRLLNRSVAFQVGQRMGIEGVPRLRRLKTAGGSTIRLLQFVWNVILLRRWILMHQPEIVHINNGGYPGGDSCRAAAVAARLAGVRVVSMFVHNLAQPRGAYAVQEAGLDRLVGNSLDTLIAASQASAETLIARRAFPRRLITVIPYGIEMPAPTPTLDAAGRIRLGLPSEGMLVGAVARLEPRKGQAYLLEAAARVVRAHPDAHVVIVGSGPSEEEYRALAAGLGIAAAVTFTGQREDVDQLLRAFDVFVMPSVDFESLPFALLEAMSHGLPVVATRVAGMPEAITDGLNGLLVPPRDVDGLAAALVRLLSNAQERRDLGRAARVHAEQTYSTERMVDRTCDHFVRLLDSAS